MPVHCPIEAASLEEALDKFPEAVNMAVERMVEEAREMQRREARLGLATLCVSGGMGMAILFERV